MSEQKGACAKDKAGSQRVNCDCGISSCNCEMGKCKCDANNLRRRKNVTPDAKFGESEQCDCGSGIVNDQNRREHVEECLKKHRLRKFDRADDKEDKKISPANAKKLLAQQFSDTKGRTKKSFTDGFHDMVDELWSKTPGTIKKVSFKDINKEVTPAKVFKWFMLLVTIMATVLVLYRSSLLFLPSAMQEDSSPKSDLQQNFTSWFHSDDSLKNNVEDFSKKHFSDQDGVIEKLKNALHLDSMNSKDTSLFPKQNKNLVSETYENIRKKISDLADKTKKTGQDNLKQLQNGSEENLVSEVYSGLVDKISKFLKKADFKSTKDDSASQSVSAIAGKIKRALNISDTSKSFVTTPSAEDSKISEMYSNFIDSLSDAIHEMKLPSKEECKNSDELLATQIFSNVTQKLVDVLRLDAPKKDSGMFTRAKERFSEAWNGKDTKDEATELKEKIQEYVQESLDSLEDKTSKYQSKDSSWFGFFKNWFGWNRGNTLSKQQSKDATWFSFFKHKLGNVLGWNRDDFQANPHDSKQMSKSRNFFYSVMRWMIDAFVLLNIALGIAVLSYYSLKPYIGSDQKKLQVKAAPQVHEHDEIPLDKNPADGRGTFKCKHVSPEEISTVRRSYRILQSKLFGGDPEISGKLVLEKRD